MDKNPLAVELCRVALWIEGHCAGKAARRSWTTGSAAATRWWGCWTFRCWPEGIPDEAFDPVADDEKDVARDLKRANRSEREGQRRLPFDVRAEVETLAKESLLLDGIADDTPEEIQDKARAYSQFLQKTEKNRIACDLWTAAFFTELTRENLQNNRIPTTDALLRYLEGGRLDARLVGHAKALAHRHRFFHWPLEFPEVFAAGGFDAVLCNPPWERIKLQEQEFFAARDPEIAGAPNKAARQKLIQALAKRAPELWQEYRQALHDADALSKYLRRSTRFPFTARGDINTYAVFAELFAGLVKLDGRGGVVLPTGIATDDTNKHFFAHLVEIGRLASLFDFENREGVFPGVHRSYKFCLLTLRGKADGKHAPAEFLFFATRPEHLRDERRRFTLTADDFRLFNPNTRTAPIFRSRHDAELTKHIYRRVPVLVEEAEGGARNPWGVEFMRMFDMANDSGLFRTREELEREGFRLQGNVFVSGAERYLPLYEAKMVHQFDHRFGDYRDQPQGSASTQLPQVPLERLADPAYWVLPRYWVAEEETLLRIARVPPFVTKAARIASEEAAFLALRLWLWGYALNTGYGLPADLRPAEEEATRFARSLGLPSRFDALRRKVKEVAARYPLSQAECDEIIACSRARSLLWSLLDRKSPRWLLGWRDIARSTDERTVIAAVIPRVGVGHTLPLFLSSGALPTWRPSQSFSTRFPSISWRGRRWAALISRTTT
ncbi:MAG: hypothetical protein KatS3mg082_3283 [Nitrospiraceae bacterium]|nr:MAG: hypothetical protein KatS3mg082_3283 [Nitrospiraceae bacterium]